MILEEEGNAYHDLDEVDQNKGFRHEAVDMNDKAIGYIKRESGLNIR